MATSMALTLRSSRRVDSPSELSPSEQGTDGLAEQFLDQASHGQHPGAYLFEVLVEAP